LTLACGGSALLARGVSRLLCSASLDRRFALPLAHTLLGVASAIARMRKTIYAQRVRIESGLLSAALGAREVDIFGGNFAVHLV
jgi:hypothetical protein